MSSNERQIKSGKNNNFNDFIDSLQSVSGDVKFTVEKLNSNLEESYLSMIVDITYYRNK